MKPLAEPSAAATASSKGLLMLRQPLKPPHRDRTVAARTLLVLVLAAGAGGAAFQSTAWSNATSVATTVYLTLGHAFSDAM